MEAVRYSINGSYFSKFNIYISESKGLLDTPPQKQRKTYSWAEEHGVAIDLSRPKYEAREITLSGWVEGSNWQEMKRNFDLFLKEFDNVGTQRLMVEFDGGTLIYDIYISGGIELKKTFSQGEMAGVFSLKLIEPQPVKKVLKLLGKNLSLTMKAPSWVTINIDGSAEVQKGTINATRTLQPRKVKGVVDLGKNLIMGSSVSINRDYTTFDLSVRDNLQFLRGKTISSSVEVEYNNASGGRIGFETAITYADNTNGYINSWRSVGVNETFVGQLKNTIKLPDKEIKEIRYTGIYIQTQGSSTRISNPKLEIGTQATEWTIAPEDVHYITIAGNIDEITELQTNAEILW